MIMERIDFYEKKEALHKEMLKYISDCVEIAGGEIDIHRMVGYVIISPDGAESTREICVDELKLRDGFLYFHDANAIDEANEWIGKDDVLCCSIDSVCDSVDKALLQISEREDFAEEKRNEFTDYVESVFPGFSSRVHWEYFENLKTMDENLITQVHLWI